MSIPFKCIVFQLLTVPIKRMPQFAENLLRLEKSCAANQALVPAREVAILENIALGQMFVKMVSFS